MLPNSSGHPRGTSVVAPAAGELRLAAGSPPCALPARRASAKTPRGCARPRRSQLREGREPATVDARLQWSCRDQLDLQESLKTYFDPVASLRRPSHWGSASSRFPLKLPSSGPKEL